MAYFRSEPKGSVNNFQALLAAFSITFKKTSI